MEYNARQSKEQGISAHQVHRCIAGDALAWQELVGSYYRFIFFLCYKFTRCNSDAEDLTQDIFLKLFCNLSRFDIEKGSFNTWIKNVTRNHLVDHFRTTQLLRMSDSLDEGEYEKGEICTMADRLTDVRPSPEQHFASLEVKTRIYTALGQISVYCRDAVILCDLEDRDYLEASQMLGIPLGTVKSRLSRGRAELARILSSTNEAGDCGQVNQSVHRRVIRKEAKIKTRRRFGDSVGYQPSMA